MPSRQTYPRPGGRSCAVARRRSLLRALVTGSGSRLDRFVSHYTNRFDAKGRVSIPASFRAVLAKDGFEGLYVHPSLDAPALDCGGNALLREIDALLETMPAYSEQRDAFATALLGTSEILRPDAEGRVILERGEPGSCGLDQRSGFRRAGTQVSDLGAEAFRGHLEEAKTRVRQLRAELGARAARAAPQRRAGMIVGRSEGQPAAGGPARHIPVLLEEVVSALGVKEGGVYLDGTFGAGGYSARHAWRRRRKSSALDRDPEAIAGGRDLVEASGGRLRLCRGALWRTRRHRPKPRRSPSSTASSSTSASPRCSSTRPRAAFRCASDAPLDMRMGARGRTAADILARRRRGDDRRYPLSLWRGARLAPHRPRHRRRPADRALSCRRCSWRG